jgi:Alw26I/Eco31I/Esp3I family type II restriction endonuclease
MVITPAVASPPKKGVKSKEFLQYMTEISDHPNYAGMPDRINAKGATQWEAPSNRLSGQFQFTHQRRREWWEKRAKELGIAGDKWISKTAKKIHPTGRKPCSVCGRVLDINYVYPTKVLQDRIGRLSFLRPDFVVDPFEGILSLVKRLYREYGPEVSKSLPALFHTSTIKVPVEKLKGEREWLEWLQKEFIPLEPRILSPGAMSNAPDRFDGFHTFNICCRKSADKGRHTENLKQYVTDRRVFEHWAAGDWIAANELMGRIRVELSGEPCRCGRAGPCDADHVGPISLGFCHSPYFQLLCTSCNSAKNNRMTHSDVVLLLEQERGGHSIVSWHSQALWDTHKHSVKDDKTGLRLSKLLRDNRHALMNALKKVADAGHLTFLTAYLELERAESDVTFVGLRAEDHLTKFEKMIRTPRQTKYANEQKVRRLRIAFEELVTYHKKENRNIFLVADARSAGALKATLDLLKNKSKEAMQLDKELAAAFASRDASGAILNLLPAIAKIDRAQFQAAGEKLKVHMDEVGPNAGATLGRCSLRAVTFTRSRRRRL